MRNTKQKELILNIVNNSYSHPTAEDVYKECRKFIPNISLGTVYRNLNQLVDSNKIKRLKASDNKDHFDHIDLHNHFFCTQCGIIIDIPSRDIPAEKLLSDCKVLDCYINYSGICKECLNKEGEN